MEGSPESLHVSSHPTVLQPPLYRLALPIPWNITSMGIEFLLVITVLI